MRTLKYINDKIHDDMETNDCAQNPDKITMESLANAVKDMRHAQRRYFATRDRNVLLTSKKLEQQVDAMITRIFDRQQYLF